MQKENTPPLQEAAESGLSRSDLFGWLPIAGAPKDQVVLVNDTTGQSPWAAARWVESPEWSGWIYDDDAAADCNPTGPEPTHWLDVPSLPNAEHIRDDG